MTPGYKQYIMLLDPADPEELKIIKHLERRHTKKRKVAIPQSYKSHLSY